MRRLTFWYFSRILLIRAGHSLRNTGAVDVVKNVRCPLFVLHGTSDEVGSARRIYSAGMAQCSNSCCLLPCRSYLSHMVKPSMKLQRATSRRSGLPRMLFTALFLTNTLKSGNHELSIFSSRPSAEFIKIWCPATRGSSVHVSFFRVDR